jgi:hypothetical protein
MDFSTVILRICERLFTSSFVPCLLKLNSTSSALYNFTSWKGFFLLSGVILFFDIRFSVLNAGLENSIGLDWIKELCRLSEGDDGSFETSSNWSMKFFLAISSDWSKSLKSTSLFGGVLRFFIIFVPKMGDSGDS